MAESKQWMPCPFAERHYPQWGWMRPAIRVSAAALTDSPAAGSVAPLQPVSARQFAWL